MCLPEPCRAAHPPVRRPASLLAYHLVVRADRLLSHVVWHHISVVCVRRAPSRRAHGLVAPHPPVELAVDMNRRRHRQAAHYVRL